MRTASVPRLAAITIACLLTACGGEVRLETTTTAAGGTSMSSTSTGGATATGGAGGSPTTSISGAAGAAGSMSSSGGAAGSQGSGATGGGGCVPITERYCGLQLFDCGDALDNDGDGLIDAEDPDCLGPCDNDEANYYSEVPGESAPKCQLDCAFDRSHGPGDDDCYWSHRCDPLEAMDPGHPEPASLCPYNPDSMIWSNPTLTCAGLEAQQSAACLSFCGPLTPNGCDCFGCCELPAGSGNHVWINAEDGAGLPTCSAAAVSDPTKCEPCTPVVSCLNTCEPCELCVGKTTLPPECAGPDGTPLQACPDGLQPCGLGCQDACPAGTYCITGCCQPSSML